MSAVENSRSAVEEHQKTHVLEKTQKSTEDANKRIHPKKRKAAMLAQLQDLTSEIEDASNQVVKDERKLGAMKSSAPKSKKQKTANAKDSDKTAKAPPETRSYGDPLLALMEAGATIQTETNEIVKALGRGATDIIEATTDASKAGRDWIKNFHDHGITSGDPGSYDTSAIKKGNVWYFYSSDQHKWATSTTKPPIPDPKTHNRHDWAWVNWVNEAINNTGSTTPPPGLSAKDQKLALDNPMDGNTAKGYAEEGGVTNHYQTIISGSNGIPGATGSGMSAKYNQLVNEWQFVQQQVAQVNNNFEVIAGLPATMMQALTTSINTGNGMQQSNLQAISTTSNLLRGWAGL